MYCDVWGDGFMKTKKKATTKELSGKMRRTTVSLPAETQEQLEMVAKQKKVSVGWVIRDAIDKYFATNAPLYQDQ
jgi:predicted DNA-binding protein